MLQIESGAIRRWTIKVLSGVVGVVAAAVSGQWFIEVADDKGLYTHAGERWDKIMRAALEVLASPAATHTAFLAVGVIAGLMLDWRWFQRREVKTPTPVWTEKIGLEFRNERVPLDYVRYINCTFYNVCFTYDGGEVHLERNKINGALIEATNPQARAFGEILHEFGFFKYPTFDEHGEKPRSSRTLDNEPATQ